MAEPTERSGSALSSSLIGLGFCAALVPAAVGLSVAAQKYLPFHAMVLSSSSFKDHRRFLLICAAMENYGPVLQQGALATAVALLVVALVLALWILSRRPAADERVAAAVEKRAGAWLGVTTVFVGGLAACAALANHARIPRQHGWMELASVGLLVVAVTVAGVRAFQKPSETRVPWRMVQSALLAALFFLGAADIARRLGEIGDPIAIYMGGSHIVPADVVADLRLLDPRADLLLIDCAVVLLTLVLSALASRYRGARAPGGRGLTVVVGLATLLVVGGYAAVHQRVRRDLAVYTRGDGSLQDILAYASILHERPSPPPRGALDPLPAPE